MRPAWILTLTLAAAPCIGLAAAGEWQTERPAKPAAKMGKGKTLSTWPSPNRRFVLAWRDEGEVGDFVWRTLYLKHPKGYTTLSTYNQIGDVQWSKDSRTVRFRAVSASGPDTLDHQEVHYTPATNVLRWRVVKSVKL